MAAARYPRMIRALFAERAITPRQVRALARWVGTGASRAQAEALLAANAATGGRDADLSALLVDTLTDMLVWGERPSGRLTDESAEWLMRRLGPVAETRAELDLVLAIVEAADQVPARLAAYALAQVRHAAITGEGPAARGRAHPSRTVDAADVRLIGRLVAAIQGAGRRPLPREAAEVLFDIAETCQSERNDRAWGDMFTMAMLDHLGHAAGPALHNWLEGRLAQGWPHGAGAALRARRPANEERRIPALAEVA